MNFKIQLEDVDELSEENISSNKANNLNYKKINEQKVNTGDLNTVLKDDKSNDNNNLSAEENEYPHYIRQRIKEDENLDQKKK